MKKKTVVLALSLVAFVGACGLLVFHHMPAKTHVMQSQQKKTGIRIKIAACPTYHGVAKNLDPAIYAAILADSTKQIVSLLKNGAVGAFICGRTLLPAEPQLDYRVIQEGYSFLSARQIILYETKLKHHTVFTDLEPEKIKALFSLEDVVRVDDVYHYLHKGIVVTSWGNTDHTRAAMVHLLKADGRRVPLSRRLTLYCAQPCSQTIIEDVIAAVRQTDGLGPAKIPKNSSL